MIFFSCLHKEKEKKVTFQSVKVLKCFILLFYCQLKYPYSFLCGGLPPTQNHEDSWSESQQIISVSQSQTERD